MTYLEKNKKTRETMSMKGKGLTGFLAVMMAILMVITTIPVTGDTITEFDGIGADEITLTFPEGGGSSVQAKVTMPSIAVARTAVLKVSSDSTDEKKFADYRDDEVDSIDYSGNYYHDFPPVGSEWNHKEMSVNDNGAKLRRYTGLYNPYFGEWGFVDNASTDANYLEDDGFDSRIVSGGDNGADVWYPGPTSSSWDCQGCSSASKKSSSKTKTYFMDGRLFKYVKVRADGNTYSWSYYAIKGTVKGWNVNTEQWDTLADEVNCGTGSVSNYVFYEHTWSTPRYSQIQVKVKTAASWSSYYAGFEFQGRNQGFMDTSTFTSRGEKVSVDGTVNEEWNGWDESWDIYDAKLIPDETVPSGTNINYYISADNGSHWEQVTGNQTHVFQNPGNELRWKAVFSTNSDKKTASINDLRIRINRLYSTEQTFVSGIFDSKWPITAIKPVWNETVAPGTDIAISVSNDNGTEWITVDNGEIIDTPWQTPEGLEKTELKWKAVLTSDGTATPHLRNITLHYIQSMYPSDVVIRTGNLNEPLWSNDGFFFEVAGEQDVDGNDLVIDLNYILPHLEQGDMTIPLNVSSATAGKITLSSLNIVYGLPPVLEKDIPEQVIDEDSGKHEKILDLETFFSDDFDDGKMDYEIPFQEDPGKVKAWIQDGHYLSVETVKEDWYGDVRFVVRAMDSVGLKTQSNTFTISVQNVNDKPSLQQPPDFTLIVNEHFEYTLRVDDADLDSFTFSMTPNILNIESSTGKISYTPTKDQIDVYDVTYTVTDKGGLSDSKTGVVEIVNKNTAPTLKKIGPQFPTVDEKFDLQVEATDPDMEYNDVMTYSLEFEDVAVPEGMTIDPDTGLLTWTPEKAGSYWATVKVTDREGATDSEFVTFTVERVNTAPYDLSIDSPSDGAVFNTTTEISFVGSVTDDDVGDKITYTWYLDGVQFGTKNHFQTVISETGTHTIKLTVSDGRKDHERSTEISIEIEEGAKKRVDSDDDKKVEESGAIPNSLLWSIVLIVALVVVVIVSSVYGRGGDKRKKLRQLEAEMRGEVPQQPQQTVAEQPMEQPPEQPMEQPPEQD